MTNQLHTETLVPTNDLITPYEHMVLTPVVDESAIRGNEQHQSQGSRSQEQTHEPHVGRSLVSCKQT